MYQPEPAGGQPPLPSQPPRPVLNAVKLMYVGAAVEIVGLVLNLATIGSTHANAGSGIAGAAIGAALWLWMASANKAGKNWARITSTVLFAIDCLFLLLILLAGGFALSAAGGLASALVVVVLIASILVWLIGLGAVILLWQKESSAYFAAMSAQQ